MAAVFRIFGIFTLSSLTVIQILNCAFASLTVFPIYAIARRNFGAAAALLASWLWVFLPSAIHTPLADIWDTSLTAFVLASILWATRAVDGRHRPLHWVLYGALWALGGLTNAAILSVFPFFIAWLAWHKRKVTPGWPELSLVGISVLALAVLLAPWTIRNHRALGSWIPLRSNFGLELWLGNNPAGDEANSFALHPFQNALEARRFQALGEIAYVRDKQREAVGFMRAHPVTTGKFIGHRVAIYWFAVSDRPLANWRAAPFYLKVLFIPNLLMILLSWFGAIQAALGRRPEAILFAVILTVFPLPYYITHALVRYRFPIDPLIAILSVYGLSRALPSARRDRISAHRLTPCRPRP